MNHLGALAHKTQLVFLTWDKNKKDGVKEHASGFPTTGFTASLHGRKDELEAARALIQQSAARQSLPVTTELHGGSDPYLEVKMQASVQDGDLRIIGLIHKATQCDIGAVISAHTGRVTVPSEFYTSSEGRGFTPSIQVAIRDDAPLSGPLKRSILDYLEVEINRLQDKERPALGEIVRHDDEMALSLVLRYRTTSQARAMLRAEGVAEHVSGMLGVGESLRRR